MRNEVMRKGASPNGKNLFGHNSQVWGWVHALTIDQKDATGTKQISRPQVSVMEGEQGAQLFRPSQSPDRLKLAKPCTHKCMYAYIQHASVCVPDAVCFWDKKRQRSMCP